MRFQANVTLYCNFPEERIVIVLNSERYEQNFTELGLQVQSCIQSFGIRNMEVIPPKRCIWDLWMLFDIPIKRIRPEILPFLKYTSGQVIWLSLPYHSFLICTCSDVPNAALKGSWSDDPSGTAPVLTELRPAGETDVCIMDCNVIFFWPLEHRWERVISCFALLFAIAWLFLS